MRSLEEVVGCSPGDVWLSSPGRGVELEEGVLETVVQLHYSRLVPTSVAVIRRAEYRHHVPLMTPTRST